MSKNPGDDVLANIERVVLQRVKVGLMSRISPEVLDQMTCKVEYDYLTDHIEVAFLTYLYAGREHVQSRTHVYVPKTWWEHLKQRWFPKRLLKRWPVKEEPISVVTLHQHVCPHLQIPMCGERSHIDFLESPGIRCRPPDEA
jgi:hypothetical protein